MIAVFGDFVLGKESPLVGPGPSRVVMGNPFNAPFFTPILKVITTMMTDEAMIAKYPHSADAKKIIDSTHTLKLMMNPSDPTRDFSDVLSSMCVDNYNLSKKMAKIHIKCFNVQNQM